jgi:hypothetical protein
MPNFASPEDVILRKLIRQREKFNFSYIRQWVSQFELENDWQRARVAAGVSHLGEGSTDFVN